MPGRPEWTKRHPFADEIGDGFDPAIPYQMIPALGTRPLGLRTGMYPVELNVSMDVSCGMENFHATDPLGMVLPDVPAPGSGATKSVKLPANVTVYFDLRAGIHHSSGKLRVHEVVEGRTLPYPTIELLLSVMREKSVSITHCYVFDEINPDTGRRYPYDEAIKEADKIFFNQANVHVNSAGSAKTISVPGSLGATFDPIDDARVHRVLATAVQELGPGIFNQGSSAVIFHIPMTLLGTGDWDPVTHQAIKRERPLALTVPYTLGGTACDVIWVTDVYPENNDTRLSHTMPHEIGHFLGLEHLPQTEEEVFPKGMPVGPKKAKYQELWLHNLMYPSNFIRSKRLNGSHIERAHLGRPNLYRVPV